MPVEIQLTQGQTAIVCDCHAHLVKNYRWCAIWRESSGSFYAARNISVSHNKKRTLLMHRVINETMDGMDTDHIDRNSLNNQCSNLRSVTKSQNQQNRDKPSNNTSGHKGVYWSEDINKWQVRIRINRQLKYIGSFSNIKDATRARDEATLKYHGKYSNLGSM